MVRLTQGNCLGSSCAGMRSTKREWLLQSVKLTGMEAMWTNESRLLGVDSSNRGPCLGGKDF